MEPMPSLDYTGALTQYTPWVMAVIQVIKQSPKVDNRKLPYYSVILGVAIALATLAVAGKLMWTTSGLYFDPTAMFKALIEGTFGGAAGPAGYFLQRQMPINLLAPGPDNFGEKPTPPVNTIAPLPLMEKR